MKILYIAFKDFSIMHYGASKKVISACRALEKNGHEVTLIGRDKDSTALVDTMGICKEIKKHRTIDQSKIKAVLNKKNQINDIIKYIQDKSYDFCYIRFDLNTRCFIKLLKKLKLVCKKIVIEIPTYPYDKEYVGLINKVRLIIDDYYGKKLKNYVSRIISFYDIPNSNYFGVPTLVVPNGFDFDNIEIVKSNNVPNDIDIAAVSSMRIWHGYERLIEGLHLYYRAGGDRNITVHIVGNGPELQKYKSLTEKYNLDKHIVFYGALHGKKLDDILERCTIGVDSLGRHRTGINVLSSLKSREYGAKGIPIINSCKIDIIEERYPYFLQVPANEEPIDINHVVSFYDKIYKNNNRKEVAENIRKHIEQKSSMETVMNTIINEVLG
ncbi:glycosyltransferase [Clostridium paraputrificum]|uniref:glycosyltransferase n=1 Tax=Clostridium TaxID=1485 RepID=UPI0012B9D95F|nr:MULTISPECIES: glycosyltransferase [Clostridium]MBS6888906.1 glycosyltransferase family 4 protein [Clostridium sp.]MDB2074985.1 glycosyltransferase [Clostridium paraputrificum]MDB2078232.1 glycosyltransferase [Clostridium paraputrificum]MDU2108051.1 glycosyltransferase [Clostridium sp.]MDU3354595.1 glycosyltransferase [Clostridium sp.]